MRTNERTDERVAQYFSLYSWLLLTIVEAHFGRLQTRWECLEAHLGCLVAHWGHQEAHWERLEAHWEHLVAHWECLEAL